MKRQVSLSCLISVLAAGCGASPSPAPQQASEGKATAGEPSGQPPVVGGPCAYDEFAGTCRLEPGTEAVFTFEGNVAGQSVVLHGNEPARGAFASPGESKACTLSLIRTGTCTPCLLSVGSCGKEGFELLGRIRK